MRREGGDFIREITQAEIDDLGVPVRIDLGKSLQLPLRLLIILQRLLRLPGVEAGIALLDQNVNDDILVVRRILGAKGGNSQEKSNGKCGEKFHGARIVNWFGFGKPACAGATMAAVLADGHRCQGPPWAVQSRLCPQSRDWGWRTSSFDFD